MCCVWLIESTFLALFSLATTLSANESFIRAISICVYCFISCVNCASPSTRRNSQRLQLHREVVNCVWSRWFVFLVFLRFPLCAGHANDHIQIEAACIASADNSQQSMVPNSPQISFRSWGSCFGIILGFAFATRINKNWRHSQSECVCARLWLANSQNKNKLLIHWMHCARHRRALNLLSLIIIFFCNNKR